ncbi:DUF5979 domain-containing protein [Lysinibacter sp. HNR]|uniref:DUF5979 domain-containing protein n=1 Tax=Lysinibacter sp. HNR TaxID=3031408 RepID=UPI002435A0FF|nr:DUF5979 domain-containing protein [Lysinibacter sp. HNR]WGD37821.1 DUF5979 domain-containing protein [Lysinibacter sp. HNR]
MRIFLSVTAVLALVGTMGLSHASPAAAEGPPVVFSLAAIEPSTGAPLTTVTADQQFTYLASVGCPDPDGCGPATLTSVFPANIEFLADSFNPPSGVKFTFAPTGGPTTGKTVTLTWENLSATSIVYIPARLHADTPASLNGQVQGNVATLIAGEEPDTSELSATSDVTLRLYEKPSLTSASMAWAGSTVSDGNGETTSVTTAAVATANAPSTLLFESPSSEAMPRGAIAASEAFDLRGITLKHNPASAVITFIKADGSTTQTELSAPDRTIEAPADSVGYRVLVQGLPASGGTSAIQRTVEITAEYQLRDILRTSGERIVPPAAASTLARATAQVTNTVKDPAPGSPATASTSVRSDVSITALAPTIGGSLSWITASSDDTSVYGSAEASTSTVRVSNTGVVPLSSLRLTAGVTQGDYFNYQALTAAPGVTFPAGAVSATVQYNYAQEPREGAAQQFVRGEATPDTAADGRSLDEVASVSILFSAAPDGAIARGCALADDSCAGMIVFESQLRNTHLANGSAIVAPPSSPGSRSVYNSVQIVATASTGAVITQSTNGAILTLVKPQYGATLVKRLGDGSDDTSYPLTGVAQAGDLYHVGVFPQDFRDHRFRLIASTERHERATEDSGSPGFTIADPQTAPTVEKLGEDPFNSTRFSALSNEPVACLTDGGTAVGSTTTMMVWVVDRIESPTSITKIDYVPGQDLSLVVGVEYTVLPTDSGGLFPINVSCETPSETTVKFRDRLLTSGEIVSPTTLGSPNTPGLYSVGNTAELNTGTNLATATGSDSLYLLLLDAASIIKHYDTDAPHNGVQGQSPRTAFLLAAVPNGDDSVGVRVTDTGVPGSSLDIFQLNSVRDAKVGPDQVMTISLFDREGNPVGPTGTVIGPTELGGTQLTAEEIEDSQGRAYLNIQKVKRKVTWSAELTPEQAAQVYNVQVDVTRSDPDAVLQQYGAISVVIDVSLRSHRLSNPSAPVVGSLEGISHYNRSQVFSTKDGIAWASSYTATARYEVYAPDRLLGDSAVDWRASDGTDYVVAQDQTRSRISLEANNKTALGVADVAPEDQWQARGSLPVGVDSLAVGVGEADDTGKNPFAIVNFRGITEVIWPEMKDKPATGPEKDKRVDAEITYTYSDGTSDVVRAPVSTPVSELNPPIDKRPLVVGVSILWKQDGKYVGIKASATAVQARLVFETELRDRVRDGYSYNFLSGEPLALASGDSIDGAYQVPGVQISQVAQVSADYETRLQNLVKTQNDAADTVSIDVLNSAVAVSIRAVSTPILYRDKLPTMDWTLSTQNTGNTGVSALRSASPSELLDGESWPTADPDGFSLEPGSLFDAFNLRLFYVQYPLGATGATVWFRGEDGVWSDGVKALNQYYLTPPQSGDGPHTLAQVTGFRVQFEGNEVTRSRISKLASGNVYYGTSLRETLRSNPEQRSPGDSLLSNQSQWAVDTTGAGASYLGTFAAPLAQVIANRATAYVLPGTPSPLMRKYAGTYDVATNTGSTTTLANPGSWANFYVVLANSSDATSDLYNLMAVDTLPPELTYNAANPLLNWSVVSAPTGVSTTPTMTLEQGARTTMRWSWPEDQILKPGQRIVLRVPLQMVDGVAAGTTGVNHARLMGTGIEGAPSASICRDEFSVSASCVSTANATSLRNDSVRVESYLKQGELLSATPDGAECDLTTRAEWDDGVWVRNPCIVETTTGDVLTYRLKLVNSGNNSVSALRFVDELPVKNDRGTVLDSPRGSEWTPSLIPGSPRLLTGTEATSLGARGDGALANDSFRYSTVADACHLNPDAYAGPDTLGCATASWGDTARDDSRALSADIVFGNAAQLRGGEYVVVEFQMSVPATSTAATNSWNSAALSGRMSPVSEWMPVSESPRSGSRTLDTGLTVNLGLTDAEVTRWHLGAENYRVFYSCQPVTGNSVPLTGSILFDGLRSVEDTASETLASLPRGAACRVTDENYQPLSTGGSASAHYGLISNGATGYSYVSDPELPLVLAEDAQQNQLTATNVFAVSDLTIGVATAGSAAVHLPDDATFTVTVSCTFGGFEEEYGPFELTVNDTEQIANLPVGAECQATETNARGALDVTATVDGASAPLDAQRSLTVSDLTPGSHRVDFLNTFDAAADLTVIKNVTTPSATTAMGDFRFLLSCTLGGYPIDVPNGGVFGMSFPGGTATQSVIFPGLPAGAECVITETDSGRADIAADDRTVTLLSSEPVTVEMLNVYNPAALELNNRVEGEGAAGPRVPQLFEVQASCVRELTINGVPTIVTDLNASHYLAPGEQLTVGGLPAGSLCTVNQIGSYDADDTNHTSLSDEAPDQSDTADKVIVSLIGPAAASSPADGVVSAVAKGAAVQADMAQSAARSTPVLVVNTYHSAGRNTNDQSLSRTGVSHDALGLGLLVLLGLGVIFLVTSRVRRAL